MTNTTWSSFWHILWCCTKLLVLNMWLEILIYLINLYTELRVLSFILCTICDSLSFDLNMISCVGWYCTAWLSSRLMETAIVRSIYSSRFFLFESIVFHVSTKTSLRVLISFRIFLLNSSGHCLINFIVLLNTIDLYGSKWWLRLAFSILLPLFVFPYNEKSPQQWFSC
jgi:hypothetical protein